MGSKFLPYKDVVYSVIGAAMKVHSELRWGLLEAVYNESLVLELSDRGIESKAEEAIPCYYRNHLLKKEYKMDIVVGDVIVELKSVSEIVPAHRAQLFNYLRLTKKPIGLLINFGNPKLQGERYGYIEETNDCVLLDRNMEIVPQEIEWDFDNIFIM
ncbi:MAG: GxxExxY protein [Prevotella sp.]|nr:GxxExxY protein [Prevotella sp.]